MASHLLAELVEGILKIPFYYFPYCGDIPVVLFFSLQCFTGSLAITKMIFKANPVFPVLYLFFSKIIITGAQRIKTFNQVKQSIHCFKCGKRPIIFTAILYKPAGWKNPGEPFIFNTYPGIGLIVLKHDVKPGLVFFDKIVLQ